jgi:hypothetical protein
MSYTITTSDGSVQITIPDGGFNSTTSLILPGPNAIGYGQYLDQNLLQLLESFASNSAPSGTNLQGQLWFNKSNQTLNVFTTEGYLPVNGLIVSASQPVNAVPGNTWFSTTTNQYYFYDGTTWLLIGPIYTKAQGVSGAIPVTVNDAVAVGQTHNILKLQFGNVTLATLSSDGAFTPSPAISGFPTVYSGLTINNSLFNGPGQFYTNANAAAYLPTDPTIVGINANISALTVATQANLSLINTSIIVANANIKIYTDAQISTVNTNLVNNVAAINSNVSSLSSATQTSLTNINSNVQLLTAELVSNVLAINSNVANVSLAWQANATSQQTQIANLTANVYNNSNVGAYLPTYTGVVGATTLPYNTSNTAVATTAFVQSVLPRGMIIMWGGSTASIPAGWQLCNGSNGTPDLRGQFIIGAGGSYTVGNTGGVASAGITITNLNLPAHSHTYSGTVTTTGTTNSGVAAINDPGHRHPIYTPGGQGSVNSGNDLVGDSGYQTTQRYTGTATTGITDSGHAHTFSGSGSYSGTTANTGVGNPITVNTLPPFYALCYIQKMY